VSKLHRQLIEKHLIKSIIGCFYEYICNNNIRNPEKITMIFNTIVLSEKLKIKELQAEDAMKAFPLVQQLRTNLDKPEYVRMLKLMMDDGYQMICLFDDNRIVSYAGIAKRTEFIYGTHIWVYDLVTDNTVQSKGYGKLLLSNIEQWAKANSVHCIALASGLVRTQAHGFYEKAMGYERTCYGFCKKI